MTFNKTEYQANYRRDKLKRIPLDIPKEKYEEIKHHAESGGESVNGFIKRAINEVMDRERKRSL